MKFRSTIIFGAVFLALATYVYFFEIRLAERRKETERESKKVLSFERESVKEVMLTYPDRTIHCVKDSTDEWRLVEPTETEGSKEDIATLLSSLEDATIRRTVADSVERPSDYGLDVPQVTVSIRQGDEDTWRSLILGDRNPTGSYAYARKENDPAVFLVSTSLINALDKNLQDLRFKKILDFEMDDVNTISLLRGGKPIVCSKVLDEWRLEKPVQARADGDEIESIVRKLNEAVVKEFVAEDLEDAAEYGLDRPAITVDLSVGQTRVLKRLIVGKSTGETYYAKDASRDPVFTVDSSLVSELGKDAFDLRDKSVLTVKPYKVREVRLQTDKLNLRCRKDTTGTWQILEPIQVRADESEINDLLWDLEGLKAEEFVTDAPKDLAPYGLVEPRAHIQVWMEADSTALSLSVGKKKDERVYVRNSTAPSVYLVDSEFLEQIEKDVRAYRDKKILHFYTYQVSEIEFVRGHETSLWVKDSKGVWKGPSGRSLEKSDVNALLNDLQSLKAEEFVDDDPSDLSQYGLAEPRSIVTLQFEDKTLQVLHVGSEMNDMIYVRNKEIESIFLVKPEFMDKLRSLLDEEEEGT